jgi:hypothetical protein
MFLPHDQVSKSIPEPDWKQFVVGKMKKLSPHEKYMRNMLFWYKESLLGGLETRGHIVGKWTSVSLILKIDLDKDKRKKRNHTPQTL